MRQFSIKDLERFSGIKAHTIRTWEKRYNIFDPARNTANIRSYSLNDVSLILNMNVLLQYGYKISRLVGLKEDVMEQKILALRFEEVRTKHMVNKLIKNMFSNDVDEFEAILDNCHLAFGINITIHEVIIPFLEKTQVLSYKDSSIEVHLVVTAIRKKIIVAIEKLSLSAASSKTALLFLPKGEHYDLLLLYIAYLLRTRDIKVLYLGTNISLENLQEIIRKKKFDYLVTHMVSKTNFPLNEYLLLLKETLPQPKLFIAYTDSSIYQTQKDTSVKFFKHLNAKEVFEEAV